MLNLTLLCITAAVVPFLVVALALCGLLVYALRRRWLTPWVASAGWWVALLTGPSLVASLTLPITQSIISATPSLQVAAWDVSAALNFYLGLCLAYVLAIAGGIAATAHFFRSARAAGRPTSKGQP